MVTALIDRWIAQTTSPLLASGQRKKDQCKIHLHMCDSVGDLLHLSDGAVQVEYVIVDD